MRIVFLGTPNFAVPTLERLAREPGHQLVAVVCQPDRPAGRAGALRPPAVKLAAAALGLPVYQPERLRGEPSLAWLRQQAPEVLVVVAFGQLLPPSVFGLPRWGAINAHASLLPAYRGAAPIQWAIARGERRTGVTTMRIDAGLDTGPCLLQSPLDIPADATAPELSTQLARLAAELIVTTLAGLERGTLTPRPQPASGSLAPRLSRADAEADWNRPALELYNRWRGFQPWPGLHTRFRGRQLAILRCHPDPAAIFTAQPGLLLAHADALAVACAPGRLILDEVRLEGRAPTAGAAFARGARILWGQEGLG